MTPGQPHHGRRPRVRAGGDLVESSPRCWRRRRAGHAARAAGPWETHEVGLRPHEVKHLVHPAVGALELHCQTLLDPHQSHVLLVYTAVPGTESYEKLQLLSVLGAHTVG